MYVAQAPLCEEMIHYSYGSGAEMITRDFAWTPGNWGNVDEV